MEVAFLQGLGGALQARAGALGIEKFDRLVALCFVQRVAKIASGCEAMPGLLGHGFVHYATDWLAYGGIQFAAAEEYGGELRLPLRRGSPKRIAAG